MREGRRNQAPSRPVWAWRITSESRPQILRRGRLRRSVRVAVSVVVHPVRILLSVGDRPDFPSAFPVTIECRGTLDRNAFDRTDEIPAHARHPFLSARIRANRRQWPKWAAGEVPPICWTDGAGRFALDRYRNGIDVRFADSHPARGERHEFQFVFHHVAVDGMGAFRSLPTCFWRTLTFARPNRACPLVPARHTPPARSRRPPAFQSRRQVDGPDSRGKGLFADLYASPVGGLQSRRTCSSNIDPWIRSPITRSIT